MKDQNNTSAKHKSDNFRICKTKNVSTGIPTHHQPLAKHSKYQKELTVCSKIVWINVSSGYRDSTGTTARRRTEHFLCCCNTWARMWMCSRRKGLSTSGTACSDAVTIHAIMSRKGLYISCCPVIFITSSGTRPACHTHGQISYQKEKPLLPLIKFHWGPVTGLNRTCIKF